MSLLQSLLGLSLLLLLTATTSVIVTSAFSVLPNNNNNPRAAAAAFVSSPSSRPSPHFWATAKTTTTTTTIPTSRPIKAASSQEEDLELTRQIILGHLLQDYSKTEPLSDEVLDYMVDRPTNDLMIRVALGQSVHQTPVWLFRQAGRHLPEYRAYKQAVNQNFWELLQDPHHVAECTLQPLRRYKLDAAILFSDILVLPEALGIPVSMPGGVGIQIPEPLKNRQDVETRLPALSDLTADFVQDKLGHVLQAVRQIRAQMVTEQISVPLIGFSAAPWTLLYYMVGGSSQRNTKAGVHWLTTYPVASQKLLDKLTALVIEYLSAQVSAGCHMVQIFEAMGMMIDDDNFEKFALPCLQTIGTELRARHPHTPLMIFCRGACHLNDKIAALNVFHVITIDGSVNRSLVRSVVGDRVTLQGNYDPAELIAENRKTIETVQATARQMLQELGTQKLIANLGEGLGGKESPELVSAFVDFIHSESAAMIAANNKS